MPRERFRRRVRVSQVRPVWAWAGATGAMALALVLALSPASGLPGSRPAIGPPYTLTLPSLIRVSRDLGPARGCCLRLNLSLKTSGANASRLMDRLYGPRRTGARFLSPAAMARLGPAGPPRRSVADVLNRNGLTVKRVAGQSWLSVSGRFSSIARMFEVRIERFVSPGGVRFIAARKDPAVPTMLRRWISGVGRISTYPSMRTAAVLGGFSPRGILAAYDIAPLRSRGFDGAGQTVVFPEIDGVDSGALARYDALYGLPAPRLTIHGPRLTPGDEATMDVEVVHAIAPRAKLVVYDFNAHVTNSQWTDQTLGMIRASAGAVISSSVGGCDGTYNAADAVNYASAFREAALMGIAVFASSGDNGAYDCLVHGQSPTDSALGVDMPAALPYVTGVGGTTLTATRSGSWYRETVWEGPIETAGTGGGVSRFFARPSWQRAPGISASGRMVPDVSADADPASGAALVFPAGAGQGGGTSQAAPIWAGITALINQYLRRRGHQSVGFMNPALYAMARNRQPFPPFHDVTLGTNLHYPAGPGFDMATGLGTPTAWNLARDLLAYQRSRGR